MTLNTKESKNVKPLFPDDNENLMRLDTDGAYPLRVHPDDPLFKGFRDLLHEGNCLFGGPTGAGKSVRIEAITNSKNLSVLLTLLGKPDLEVEINYVDIDLIQILATLELSYNMRIENSTSYRDETNIAEFILTYGFRTFEEFEQQQQANWRALRKGSGKIRLFIIRADDFTRTQHRSIQNSILRYVESVRHYFSWRLPSDRVRFLNLQCVGTTNASLDRSQSSGFVGDMGLDRAIANRFFFYHVPQENWEDILKAENKKDCHKFIEKLAALGKRLSEEIADGGFPAIGEISLRQLRRIVQQFVTGGMSEMDGAGKLVTAVPRSGDDGVRADLLIQEYFGHWSKDRRFRF